MLQFGIRARFRPGSDPGWRFVGTRFLIDFRRFLKYLWKYGDLKKKRVNSTFLFGIMSLIVGIRFRHKLIELLFLSDAAA